MRLILALAITLALSGCGTGDLALIRCALVDHDVNKRCH